MNYIGIDIGSTCAKTVVLNEKKEIILEFVQPTGWSSIDTAEEILQKLKFAGINLSDDSSRCVATGYGRISVPYADKAVTEITCHALGAVHLFHQPDLTVIDIGGQDTKIIQIEQGFVKDFIMNDKCAAGTGRFLEVMVTPSPFARMKCLIRHAWVLTQRSAPCVLYSQNPKLSD